MGIVAVGGILMAVGAVVLIQEFAVGREVPPGHVPPQGLC
jgi:hypothetical protein